MNPQAFNTFQKDAKLMIRANQLLESAKNNEKSSLGKAANGLIWKLEKEEKFKQKQAEEVERKQHEKKRNARESGKEEEQYDFVISY